MRDELIEKVKKAKSPEEIVAISKENNMQVTLEQAKVYYSTLHSGELSDDELDSVAGGACGRIQDKQCPMCGSKLRKCTDKKKTGVKNFFSCDNCGYEESIAI